MTQYAVGVHVRSGWAVAAVATGSLSAPLILQRATLSLTSVNDDRSAETAAARALASFLNEGSANVAMCVVVTSQTPSPREHMLREGIARVAVRFGLEVVPILEEDVVERLPYLDAELGPPWGENEKLASVAALLGLEKDLLAAV